MYWNSTAPSQFNSFSGWGNLAHRYCLTDLGRASVSGTGHMIYDIDTVGVWPKSPSVNSNGGRTGARKKRERSYYLGYNFLRTSVSKRNDFIINVRNYTGNVRALPDVEGYGAPGRVAVSLI